MDSLRSKLANALLQTKGTPAPVAQVRRKRRRCRHRRCRHSRCRFEKFFFFFHVYLVCLVCLTGTPKRIIPGRYVESWRELASKPFVHVWCAVPEIKVAQVEMVIICADMRHVVSSR